MTALWHRTGARMDLAIIWLARRLHRHQTPVQMQAWDDLEQATRASLRAWS